MQKHFNIINQNSRIDETTAVKNLIEYLASERLTIENALLHSKKISEHIRKHSQHVLNVETVTHAYPLSTKMGKNMMGLSEALLRVDDNINKKNLIIEKTKNLNWKLSYKEGFKIWFLSWFLQIGSCILPKNQNNFFNKTILNFSNYVADKAIKKISYQFVLEEDIKKALEKSSSLIQEGYSFSYDMLGEAARTDEEAQIYTDQYKEAIEKTGKYSKKLHDPKSVSISIKLSSLHCRYEATQFNKIKPTLYKRLLELCQLAAQYDLLLFIDAEEAERLLLSLELLEDLLKEPSLQNWHGLGLAVQAYQKAAFYTLDAIAALGKKYNKKLYIRLVKGAYWDTEIKLDQVNGVENFTLFTRKEHTDISYMACARKMSQFYDYIFPCFATHNAISVAYIQELMGEREFEFQCLQGMGETMYDTIVGKYKVRKYAPVGKFQTLLPYLVRRLLENSSNSGYVNQILNKNIPLEEIIKNPIEVSNNEHNTMHPLIILPRNIFLSQHRENSKGADMAKQSVLNYFENIIKNSPHQNTVVYSIINGNDIKSNKINDIINPATLEKLGEIKLSTPEIMNDAVDAAAKFFPKWNNTPAEERANILTNISHLLEKYTDDLVTVLVREAGKSIKDSILEIREAVDFLRYYATRATIDFHAPIDLPGPIGETNQLVFEGRGVFLCIAPWNFPLAIFIGQIAAALAAGNTVIAKPAENTSLIGYKAIKIMLEAGLPKEAIQFLPASGKEVGEIVVKHPKLSGIAFTGSEATAKSINMSLAQRSSILPLIAETGGQNAMVVDSTALPEQVTRDVISSAFQSAGQRCSALRVLFIPENISESLIKMIVNATKELSVTLPENANCDVGPIINAKALDNLNKHVENMQARGKEIIYRYEFDSSLKGHFFAPTIIKLNSISDLEHEVFGPVLHIITYKTENIKDLVKEINSTEYGLTFAIHSRLENNIEFFSKNIRAGNIYVNRNQIGAVVGSQPFGGMGKSGTGPKAGGPFYLHKFAVEKTISTDTTAAGGNADLMTKV